MLVEALMGTRPPGTSTNPSDLEAALAKLPAPGNAALAPALIRRPEDRYPDASAMRAALVGVTP